MTRWMVYPTRRIAGWCPSYCLSEMSAEWTKMRNEMASGVEWRIKKVEKK